MICMHVYKDFPLYKGGKCDAERGSARMNRLSVSGAEGLRILRYLNVGNSKTGHLSYQTFPFLEVANGELKSVEHWPKISRPPRPHLAALLSSPSPSP